MCTDFLVEESCFRTILSYWEGVDLRKVENGKGGWEVMKDVKLIRVGGEGERVGY